jgi:hypothetical protein
VAEDPPVTRPEWDRLAEVEDLTSFDIHDPAR